MQLQTGAAGRARRSFGYGRPGPGPFALRIFAAFLAALLAVFFAAFFAVFFAAFFIAMHFLPIWVVLSYIHVALELNEERDRGGGMNET